MKKELGKARPLFENACAMGDFYVMACGGGIGMACRQAADFITRDTPETKALASGFDVARMSRDLIKRACELGDAKACARTSAKQEAVS